MARVLIVECRDVVDALAFDDMCAAIEELRPGVMPLRMGVTAVRSPGVFYGGDEFAAAHLIEAVVARGFREVRVGIADDLFTAEQATRRAHVQDSVIVAEGGSIAFLRRLPVEAVGDAATADLLRRLGLTTLGSLTALTRHDVASRLGPEWIQVHRLVTGESDARDSAVAGRMPPPDLEKYVDFEPALDSAEAVCFSSRQCIDAFVLGLGVRTLVATELTIEVTMESRSLMDPAETIARRWVHPRWFSSSDIVDRLHWQLAQGRSLSSGEVAYRNAVMRVRFVPEVVVPESVHADALWGAGTDERVMRGIARVQGMVGPEGVVRPMLQGGRTPFERQALVPWGEVARDLREVALPWPGAIPSPAPSRVLASPWQAVVLDVARRPVVVHERGAVSAEPAWLRTGVDGEITAKIDHSAGPWPIDELWNGDSCPKARFQLVAVDGRAWLMTYVQGRWSTDAVYE